MFNFSQLGGKLLPKTSYKFKINHKNNFIELIFLNQEVFLGIQTKCISKDDLRARVFFVLNKILATFGDCLISSIYLTCYLFIPFARIGNQNIELDI